MTNKCALSYLGPSPKDINPNFSDHTYDTVVCLINGESKRIIQDRYLRKLGLNKQLYLQKFPYAPLKSQAASDSYRNAALNDGGRRSSTLTNLNLTNNDFRKKRNDGHKKFLDSDAGTEHKKKASKRAKEQHKHGQAKYIQDYFVNCFQGSEDQQQRSKRMTGKNNIIHLPGVVDKGKETYSKNHNSGFHNSRKKQYKTYNLYYQSSYEFDFLEYCETQGIIHLVSSATTLKDDLYKRRYYLPDYFLNNEYVVEIKSTYIEKRQELLNPGSLQDKKDLVDRLGYKFLYVCDKNYSELDLLIDQGVLG